MPKPYNSLFDFNMEVATDHEEGQDLAPEDVRRFLKQLTELPDADLMDRVNFVESMKFETGSHVDIVAGEPDADEPTGPKGP